MSTALGHWGNDQSINRTAAINQSIAMALGQEQLGQAQQEQVQWQWGNGGNSDRSIDRVVSCCCMLHCSAKRRK
jgi:hypothetical protein